MSTPRKPRPPSTKQAIAGTRLNAFGLDPDTIILVEDAESALYDERTEIPLSPELIKSIQAHGVLEPVLVRKNGNRVECIDGRQRVKAAREVNRRLKAEGAPTIKVPAMVKRGEDHEVFAMMVTANENRIDDDPITKAKKAQRFLDMGRNTKEAAVHFGVTEGTLKSWVRLLDCAPEVRKAVAQGKLGATDAAKKFASLDREKQTEALREVLAKQTSVTDAVAKRGGSGHAKRQAGVSRTALRRMYQAENTPFTPRELALIGWISGQITEGEAMEKIPRLLGFVKDLSNGQSAPKKNGVGRAKKSKGSAQVASA